MSKATEIKLEDDRDNAENGFHERRRGIRLVPPRTSASKERSFNIGVAANMFSPRAAVIDNSEMNHSDERTLAVETNRGGSDIPVPDTLRTVVTFGVFIVACTLGFLIGRRRD